MQTQILDAALQSGLVVVVADSDSDYREYQLVGADGKRVGIGAVGCETLINAKLVSILQNHWFDTEIG